MLNITRKVKLFMKNNKKTAGCGTIIFLWVIVSAVLGVILSSINETEQGIGFIISASVFIGFAITIVITLFTRAFKASKEVKQQKKDRQEGITRYSPLIHVGGLPAPENSKASVVLTPAELIVNCDGHEYVLSIKKILDVDYQINIDEARYLRSGLMERAAASGMDGTAEARNLKHYAIISYEDAQEVHKTFLLRDEDVRKEVVFNLIERLRLIKKTTIGE